MSEPHITVNPASEITAAQWVAMIKRNPHVPEEIKGGLLAKGNTIVALPTIKKRPGTISDWPDDFAAAFKSKHWEITTAQEDFEVVKVGTDFRIKRRILFNLQKEEFEPGSWIKTGPDQQEWSPQTSAVFKTFKRGQDQDEITYGETFASEEVNKHVKKGERAFEVRLKSKKALVIIVNRFTVNGVKPSAPISSWFPFLELFATSREFMTPEDQLLETFLHELAAHAGRMSQGKESLHGNGIVEDNASTIKELFPASPTTSKINSALVEAEGHLRDIELKASSPGRSLGPVQGTSAKKRLPGPLK